MSDPVRILLLDDHGLFREGLARLLNSEPGLSVVGQCDTIDDALRTIAKESVDLVLLDYDLGQEMGTDILASLVAIKSPPRILIVTAGMTDKSIKAALAAGAVGVILKHGGIEGLIAAIRNAVGGDGPDSTLPMPPASLRGSIDRRLNSLQERPLTHRQSRALHAILDGLSNREISLEMNMSESSVKAVVQELFDKAGVRTRSQLVRVAIEKHTVDWIRKG